MPKNEPAMHDNAEDDVIELLEVVKPGKPMPLESAADAGDDDFATDLDSMLKELEKNELSDDASFPDPTPVDHIVDPNEELPMPSMVDIDNLLESLGATPDDVMPADDMPAAETSAASAEPSDDEKTAGVALEHDTFAVPEAKPHEDHPAASPQSTAGLTPSDHSGVTAALEKALQEATKTPDVKEDTPAMSADTPVDPFEAALQAAQKTAPAKPDAAPEAVNSEPAKHETADDSFDIDALLDEQAKKDGFAKTSDSQAAAIQEPATQPEVPQMEAASADPSADTGAVDIPAEPTPQPASLDPFEAALAASSAVEPSVTPDMAEIPAASAPSSLDQPVDTTIGAPIDAPVAEAPSAGEQSVHTPSVEDVTVQSPQSAVDASAPANPPVAPAEARTSSAGRMDIPVDLDDFPPAIPHPEVGSPALAMQAQTAEPDKAAVDVTAVPAVPAGPSALSLSAPGMGSASTGLSPAEATDSNMDAVDLKELDTILDNMLANAPSPNPVHLEDEPKVAPPASMISQALDASKLLAEQVTAAEKRIDELQLLVQKQGEIIADLQNNIDKYAANAAAKVIREEIAAILSAS